MKQRFLIPNDQDQPQDRYQWSRQKPNPDLGDGCGTAQVQQEDHRPPEFAELPGDVRSPGIAAETVSRITLAKYFKQDNGKVDRGGNIG